MTDRIDELQRLHDAATKGSARTINLDGYHESRVVAGGRVVLRCDTLDEPACQIEATLHVAMRNALPALLRVARAAADVACNVPTDIDERIKWLEVQVGREEWAELLASVAALAELRGTNG